MALSQSALSELLEAFRTGEGVNLIQDALKLALRELIEAEAAGVIGAGRYERTDGRTTERNGSRPRVLTTTAGDVQLRIPKLRKGSFFPSILNPRRRIDQALYAVVMDGGLRARGVDPGGRRAGRGDGQRCRDQQERGLADLPRIGRGGGRVPDPELGHTRFPYVFLDATYLHVREASRGQVVSQAVVVATGVTADGGREILGLDVGDSEDETFWRAFLTSVKDRGLAEVQLVISDQHAGLVKALTRCFAGASHQRCRVHFARNLLALVPKSHKDMVAAVFRTIFAQPDADAVAATWDHVRDELAARFPKIGPLMDDAKAEVLAFTVFPRAHWTKIWSNNPIDRLNREIKRRARVVGIFPNSAAVIRLVGAVLADAHDEWQVADRRYLSEASMALLYQTSDTDTAAITSGP